MKSIAKVKQQRRIKAIPPFCDNPMSAEAMKLQIAMQEGKIPSPPLNRSQRKRMLKRIKH